MLASQIPFVSPIMTDDFKTTIRCSAEDICYYESYENNAVDFGNTGKYMIVPPNKVSQLKEIVSFNVVIAMWNHVNVPQTLSQFNHHQFFDLANLLQEKVLFFTRELRVPYSIAESINKHASMIRDRIREWVSYHFRTVFFKNRSSHDVYNHIYHIVWYSNGTINYRETAKNLLNSLRLSEVEKYHVLCTYCLKDDIARMSPLLFSNTVLDYVDFYERPLIYYWNCYFRNELQKIPVNNISPIDSFMLKNCYVDNWFAKEYFFDRLSSDEQIENAVWLIDRYGILYQKLILMKLNEHQRLRVYLDRAVEIMTIYASTGLNSVDILATWFEIRNIITRDQFVAMFSELFAARRNDNVLTIIWISAGDDFKHHLLNHNNHELVVKMLAVHSCTWDKDRNSDLFCTLIRDADATLRNDITQKEFFVQYCEMMISFNELSILDRLFDSCFSGPQEAMPFKQCLVEKEFFGNHCLHLMTCGESPTLERLLKVCLPVAHDLAVVIFKRDLTTKEFFEKYCEKLILGGDLPMLNLLLSSCLLQDQESARFKQCLTARVFFSEYCEGLVFDDHLPKLDDILNSCLPGTEEVNQFKQNLVTTSKLIRLKCLNYYSCGNLERLNEFLSQLLPSSPNLILEYKKSLLMSPEGINGCCKFILLNNPKTDIFNRIIADSLPEANVATEFKKLVICSPPVITNLRNLILEDRLNSVKDYVDQFVVSIEDRRLLRRQIIGNFAELTRQFFFKHTESKWQALMIWWLENEKAVQELKKVIPVDAIFNEMLKDCVFDHYDPTHYLNYCRFRSNVGFSSLDRFLSWYFESPSKVKQYKLQRVDSYMNIDVVKTLLKKKDDGYIKAVMSWFFEKDTVEISKFKMKNRGRRILKVV